VPLDRPNVSPRPFPQTRKTYCSKPFPLPLPPEAFARRCFNPRVLLTGPAVASPPSLLVPPPFISPPFLFSWLFSPPHFLPKIGFRSHEPCYFFHVTMTSHLPPSCRTRVSGSHFTPPLHPPSVKDQVPSAFLFPKQARPSPHPRLRRFSGFSPQHSLDLPYSFFNPFFPPIT